MYLNVYKNLWVYVLIVQELIKLELFYTPVLKNIFNIFLVLYLIILEDDNTKAK